MVRALALVLLLATSASAQGLAVRTRVNDWLRDVALPRIQSRQTTYAANHDGRFWQGLWTHGDGSTPSYAQDTDTTTVPADRLDDAPALGVGETPRSWRQQDSGASGLSWPCRIRIDVYDGPSGTGYVVTASIIYQGNIYAISRGFGPEDRDTPWHQVVEDTP